MVNLLCGMVYCIVSLVVTLINVVWSFPVVPFVLEECFIQPPVIWRKNKIGHSAGMGEVRLFSCL